MLVSPAEETTPTPVTPVKIGRERVRSLKVSATRIADDAITIDGRLDEAAWLQVPTLPPMIQVEPRFGAPPTHESDVRVAYGDKGLYVSFQCFDNPEHISGAFPDTTGGPTSPRCVAPWRCICIEAFELSCATRRVTFGCVDQPQSVEVPPTLGECWGRVVDPLSNCERPQINTKCRRNMPCVPPDGSAIGRRCRVDTDCPDGYFCIARGAPLLGGGCATACSAVDPSCPVAHATCTRGVRLGAAAASGLYCVDARAAP